jgi:hypothetical protein
LNSWSILPHLPLCWNYGCLHPCDTSWSAQHHTVSSLHYTVGQVSKNWSYITVSLYPLRDNCTFSILSIPMFYSMYLWVWIHLLSYVHVIMLYSDLKCMLYIEVDSSLFSCVYLLCQDCKGHNWVRWQPWKKRKL